MQACMPCLQGHFQNQTIPVPDPPAMSALSICRVNAVFLLPEFHLCLYASNLLNSTTFCGAVSILKKGPVMQYVDAQGGLLPVSSEFSSAWGQWGEYETGLNSEYFSLRFVSSWWPGAYIFLGQGELIFLFCFSFMLGALWRKQVTRLETG